MCSLVIPATVVPDAPPYLAAEGELLHNWAISRGASLKQAQRIVGLLNHQWMCRLPLPPWTYRKPDTPDHLWLRFLFRRHVQHILKWTRRRDEDDPEGFGAEVNTLIRVTLFPEPHNDAHGAVKGGCEGARNAAEGGRSACSDDNHSGRLSDGTSNCAPLNTDKGNKLQHTNGSSEAFSSKQSDESRSPQFVGESPTVSRRSPWESGAHAKRTKRGEETLGESSRLTSCE